MPITAIGNTTLAGKAARNCAVGCKRSAMAGRRPIQTEIGTQTRLAMMSRTMTRSMVINVRPKASRRSCQFRVVETYDTVCQAALTAMRPMTTNQATSTVRVLSGEAAGPRTRRGMSILRLVSHSKPATMGAVARRTQKVRCSSLSIQELDTLCEAESSTRNLSAQVITGRNTSWS